MRVSDWIISRLADEGIKNIFLLPGGGAMYLNDAIVCEPRIEPISCHHEQACGIAAEAYGRTNNKDNPGFGVALVTTGPGATNIITPVAGAWIDSLPLFVISGQVKSNDRIAGRPIRQGGVQEVDIITLVKSITKYAVSIDNADEVKFHFEKALYLMKNGRPGPVWIEIPLDIQAVKILPDQQKAFQPLISNDIINLDKQISKINLIIENAKRPVFLIGNGLRISRGHLIFKKIAEKLGIPCTFTWNAADVLPWNHELYVGRPGVVAARAPNFAIQNSDCLISIGCRLDNIITAFNSKGFAREAKKIVIDIDSNELARHEMEIELKICADACNFLEAWMKKLPKIRDINDWREKCIYWKLTYTPLDGRTFEKKQPIGHFQFIDKLSDVIPEDYIIVPGSSGLAVEVFFTAFKNKSGQRFFLTSGLGSMGYGLPAAIGACIGSGRQPTICVEGDGSFMLNMQELATLKYLNLPLTLVIMNNKGYASIRNTQKNYFNERYISSGIESGLMIPDFMALAKGMGIKYEKIINIEQVNNLIFDKELKIVEVILEESEILSPKVTAIPQSDGSIISMPLEDMSPLLPRDILCKEMIIPLHPDSIKVDV
jgi:acetolactate synthase-1/2/3 large subunit